MVVDCSSEVFEFAPGGGAMATRHYISSAEGSIYRRQHLVAEEAEERFYAASRLMRASMRWSYVFQIDGQDIRERDRSGITAPGSLGGVFRRDVARERFLSASAVTRAAASAFFVV